MERIYLFAKDSKKKKIAKSAAIALGAGLAGYGAYKAAPYIGMKLGEMTGSDTFLSFLNNSTKETKYDQMRKVTDHLTNALNSTDKLSKNLQSKLAEKIGSAWHNDYFEQGRAYGAIKGALAGKDLATPAGVATAGTVAYIAHKKLKSKDD